MTILNILKKVPIFKDIAEKDLRKIREILNEKHYKKDEYIFSETDEGDEFYIVSGGRVKIYKMSTDGHIKALDYLEEGDFFGEMALLDKSPRSANALAMSDLCLFTINHDDFQKFLVKQPGILLTITKTLSQRLRKADMEIEMFSFNSVKDRLLMCLINLCGKYGRNTTKGVEVDTKFTHQDLSELVGTAREVVTRILKELKSENLVITSGNRFIIPSVAALKKKIAE
ncbi:MAG: Crp/Fnr family transcriptional regulator [Elusimicrobia bacterium]|nr:Crp/Fnr family transcriptional regulator [Elusimicrobiota bacterium]